MKQIQTSELYELKSSGIHNTGVFAAQKIAEKTKIIEYVGEKITKAESERRSEKWDSHARTKGFGLVYIFELNQRYDIDGNVEVNLARFINHSCDPNCEAVNSRGHIWIIALRDIEKGEELSYDYGYDMDNFIDHKCLCGTDKCIGYIVRLDQRDQVKRMIQKIKNS